METWVLYGFGLILMGLLLWALNRTQPAKTPMDVAQQMFQAGNIAQDIVQAAEQLWKTGKLSKEHRFDFVMDELEVLFPDLSEVQLRITIESAVFWMKYGIEKFGELHVGEVEVVDAFNGVEVEGGALRLREVKHRGPDR